MVQSVLTKAFSKAVHNDLLVAKLLCANLSVSQVFCVCAMLFLGISF